MEDVDKTMPLLTRAKLFLENEDFKNAREYCERILDQDPENGEAYFLRLLAEKKLPNADGLEKVKQLQKNKTFQLALRFADPELKMLLEKILVQVKIAEEKRLAGERCLVAEKVDFSFDLKNGVKLEMVSIAPGTFRMGSNGGDNDEKPVYQVTLTQAYYLGKYEVTQAQWRAVMGTNPSHFKGNNRPVENISWNDAMEFCKKLNEQGKAPAGWKFTLPTEAQWEYAARCWNRRKRKGYTYSGSNNIKKVAWYDGNSDAQTHDAGQKSPNELGLYDMSGNVWEWCLDWSGSYSKGAVTDPQGPQSGSLRVMRGGSWDDFALHCKVVYRRHGFPDDRFNCGGFRLALVPVQ